MNVTLKQGDVNSRPNIHRIYYILAIFDIVTVSFSLFLNHQLMDIYSAAVAENQVWSIRSSQYSNLGQLAQAVNAPGNDVFDSLDVTMESERMNIAVGEYRIEMDLAREDLEKNADARLARPLLSRLKSVDLALETMLDEASLIFSYFENSQPAQAGRRMATMDRRYADVITSLMRLREQVAEIQDQHFDQQAKQAANLRKFEYLIAFSILFMVCAVTFYGHALARRIATIEFERNANLEKLRLTEKQLRVHETELEATVTLRTEQLRASENSLLQAQKMESLGTLAGGIAHDFNNILQAILGYCDIASANLNRDSGTLANCLDEIQSGAKRAVDLVVQILAFSRKNDVTVEPVKLESIVADSMKFLRSSIPSRIEIEIELSPETRFVEANETQIHQIVTNLCMNSLHSMEESSEPCLSVSLETLSIQTPLDTFACTLAKGDYTRLSVSDTGSGIEPNNIHRIADPFFTTKGPGKGTGLGLATVLGISTKMGGGMVVESELGIGTKVQVIFPLISIDLADATTTPRDETSSLGATGHLLLVDDEKVLTDMYRLALKECGFTCDLFNDPREALKLTPAKVASYDFAIFDYTMPYMTGIELAQEFYAFALDLPIILVTGLLDYSEFESMRSPNVVEIVNKPFQIAELIGQFHKFRNAESNQSLQRRWE